VTKEGKDQINCIALADVLQKHFNWALNKSMRPSGAKLVISEEIALDWENFVKAVKGAIKMLKEKPELNHNAEVAMYGMATTMPDTCVLDNIANIHSAYVLDTL
jgi:hypothetical protein